MKKEFFVSGALWLTCISFIASCTKPGLESSRQSVAPFNLSTTSTLLTSASPTLVVSTIVAGDTLAYIDVAIDAAGNKYVSDGRFNCIRKITPAGVVTTLSGGGIPTGTGPNGPNVDGPGAHALFGAPQGIALDAAGNLYVADAGFHCIRKVEPDGFTSTIAGHASAIGNNAGFRDGSSFNALFNAPSGVAVDASGNVYVADAGNARIRVISGVTISTYAGNGVSGFADGAGASAQFSFPTGVALDASGNVYVSDYFNNRIRKITRDKVVSTLAGSATAGNADGTGTAAQFNQPFQIKTDAAGNFFVGDVNNLRIRKVTLAGNVSTFAGSGTSGTLDGSAATAQFFSPSGVAVDASGNVFVADLHSLRKISLSAAPGVYTIAGNATAGSIDGTGAAALFNSPDGLAIDVSGNILIADQVNQKIRMMTTAGTVTTLAGSIGGFRDGTLTTARFNAPTGVATDGQGNIYVADQINQRIRKITPAGVVSTIAGDGTRGYIDGNGVGAEFRYPTSLAVDGSGNIYVADVENFVIRKITPAGVVSTLAGSGAAGFADNTGTAAKFTFPQGIAVDQSSGNIYVADKNSHRIRKVTPAGVVTTFAGNGKAGYVDGAAATAQFNLPISVSVDVAGNVLVTDLGNQRIRKISPDGIVSTIAGNGTAGFADGIPGQAQFNNPYGVVADQFGGVYVGDKGNNRIRKIQ